MIQPPVFRRATREEDASESLSGYAAIDGVEITFRLRMQVERVVLNALTKKCGSTAKYLLRRFFSSSSEKPIHLNACLRVDR
jgi:hypothetical protein